MATIAIPPRSTTPADGDTLAQDLGLGSRSSQAPVIEHKVNAAISSLRPPTDVGFGPEEMKEVGRALRTALDMKFGTGGDTRPATDAEISAKMNSDGSRSTLLSYIEKAAAAIRTASPDAKLEARLFQPAEEFEPVHAKFMVNEALRALRQGALRAATD